MKSYHGRRTRYGCRVRVCEDNQPPRFLDPRLDLCNHSPTGFEWGYPGSGPAQLALAILADFLGDDARAIALHQEFKWEHVWTAPAVRGVAGVIPCDRLHPCIRPICTTAQAAGHDEVRERGPKH
ncbi:MAG TPA: DUF6166 domain-containing protein, partial [Stellaceae bacterium]|nr:DUF6166 domain-containing protein [Stellaceae bacterium]